MPNILVVDDEFPIRELLKTILESQSYSVDTAENGQQALEKLRKGAFHLTIIDMMMPGMSGIETVKVIRNDAKLKAIPVLMCTSVSVTRDVDAAFEAGANGYIVKTMLDAKRVIDKVKSVLGA